jgi:hypothetical protein
MMRSYLSAIALAAFAVGCSSSNEPESTPDTSTEETGDETGTDTGTPPDGDTGVEDTDPDGGVLTKRVHTGKATLDGVTDDGFVIFTDATKATFAVPLDGGAEQPVATASDKIFISGKVVFTWTAIDTQGFGTLRAWTAAGGGKSIATKSLAPLSGPSPTYNVAASSTDGSTIAFLDNGVAGPPHKADFKIAKADGTSAKVVLAGQIVHSTTDWCGPYMIRAGSLFMTSHCSLAGMKASLDVSSFDDTGKVNSLATGNTTWWNTDPAGSSVALVTSGALKLIAPTGGATTNVDTGVELVQFTRDGKTLIYTTAGGGLKTSPVMSPSPLVIVASGVVSTLGSPSPDGKWMMYATKGSPGAYDIHLASLTTAGPGATLLAEATGDTFGDTFTADSKYALFFSGVSATDSTGTFKAAPVAGGTAATLGTKAFVQWSAKNGKNVVSDGWVMGKTTIRVVDPTGTASPKIIDTDAAADVILNPTRDRIIYGKSSGKDDGIYVAPVP